MRVWTLKMQVFGDHTPLHGQQGFDDAGNPGSRFQMAGCINAGSPDDPNISSNREPSRSP